MKKSRYTDRQIINILKQAEAGTPVPELCREHGMSNASFYKWRAKYGGMDASLLMDYAPAWTKSSNPVVRRHWQRISPISSIMRSLARNVRAKQP